jgi:hypothetical protein
MSPLGIFRITIEAKVRNQSGVGGRCRQQPGGKLGKCVSWLFLLLRLRGFDFHPHRRGDANVPVIIHSRCNNRIVALE